MKKTVELSKRMQAVADLVTRGNRVCDVGCDHGFVPIYLVQSGISPSAFAMDVNKGPLLRAEDHIGKYGLSPYIKVRLSNGLSAYEKGEADTMICAGMGGRLMQEILLAEPEKTADFKELILQPQSELPLFRKFLRQQGYLLIHETMILEEGKYYVVMKAVPAGKAGDVPDHHVSGGEHLTDQIGEDQEVYDFLGPCLLKEKSPLLLTYIDREISSREELIAMLEKQPEGEKNLQRKQELTRELTLLKKGRGMVC